MRSSTKRPYRFAIILVSIASIFPTFAVLVAGSPSYGLVSELWKYIPVPVLLLVAFVLCSGQVDLATVI